MTLVSLCTCIYMCVCISICECIKTDKPQGVFLCCVCELSRFSHVQLFATLWTVACQAPLSMGFSRQEYWSGLPCPPPGKLPEPGIEPTSLSSPALAHGFFTTGATWEAHFIQVVCISQSHTPLLASTSSRFPLVTTSLFSIRRKHFLKLFLFF